MPRRAALTCADCGKPMHRSATSLPQGQARCRTCRGHNAHGEGPQHGTHRAYLDGCKCGTCREGVNRRAREYAARYKERTGQSLHYKQRPPKRTPCTDCGTPLRGGGTSTTPRCQPCLLAKRYRSRRAATRRKRAAAKLAAAAVGVPANPNWPLVVGTCASCDEPFTRRGMASAYCSVKCKRTDRPNGSWITRRQRLAIYERDDWTCQLCMEPVDPSLPYLDNWAASLDHIQPQSLTLVPDHSPSNLRLAHRWCNSVLGDGTYYTEADLRGSDVA